MRPRIYNTALQHTKRIIFNLDATLLSLRLSVSLHVNSSLFFCIPNKLEPPRNGVAITTDFFLFENRIIWKVHQ